MQEANASELCARIQELEQALLVEREKSRDKDALIDELRAARNQQADSSDEDNARCGCLPGLSSAYRKNQERYGQTRDGARVLCDGTGSRRAVTHGDTNLQDPKERERTSNLPSQRLRGAEGGSAVAYGPLTLEQHHMEESKRRPPPRPPQDVNESQETNGNLPDADAHQSPGISLSKRSSRRVVFAQDVKEADVHRAAMDGDPIEAAEGSILPRDLRDLHLSQMSQSFTASHMNLRGENSTRGLVESFVPQTLLRLPCLRLDVRACLASERGRMTERHRHFW